MFGDAARQLRGRLREGSVRHEDDLEWLLLPAPQPVATALQYPREPVPQEAHLLVERNVQVRRKVARFRTDQWNRCSLRIDSGNKPSKAGRFDEDCQQDRLF